MELTEAQLQRRAEYRRQLDEEFKRKTKYKNGAEALQAFRDLFDSDEEMEEFGRYLQQERENERAPGTATDPLWPSSSSTPMSSRSTGRVAFGPGSPGRW